MNKRLIYILLFSGFVIVLAIFYIQNNDSLRSNAPSQESSTAKDNTSLEDNRTKQQAKEDNQSTQKADKKDTKSTPKLSLPTGEEHPISPPESIDSQQQAQELADKEARRLGLGDDSQLRVLGDTKDEYGNQYYQIEHTSKGIPIYGGSALIELEQGKATQLSGNWYKEIELDVVPQYQAVEALQLALAELGVDSERGVKKLSEASLIILVADDGPHLCWEFSANLTNPDSSPEYFVVDANQPLILLRRNLIES